MNKALTSYDLLFAACKSKDLALNLWLVSWIQEIPFTFDANCMMFVVFDYWLSMGIKEKEKEKEISYNHFKSNYMSTPRLHAK